MNKKYRILTIILIAVLLAVLAAPISVLAAEKTLIVDEIGKLSDSEKATLNAQAQRISETYGVDVAFFLVTDAYKTDYTLPEYTEACYKKQNMGQNGVILLVDEVSMKWYIAYTGTAMDILTEQKVEDVFDAYDEEDTYYDGIVAYLNAMETLLSTQGSASVNSLPADRQLPRFVDKVGLLNEQQAAQLTKKLDEISQRQQFDVVVAVVPELDHREARLFAADFYEQNGFGFGKNMDGAILLLATKDRDFGFASCGFGLTAFTPVGQEYLDKLFLPYLKKDQYFEAFMAYADGVDDFVTKAKAGEPYDKGNIPKTPEEKFKMRLNGVWISLVVALLLALGITSSWKRQLISVRREDLAHAYVREGSVILNVQNDQFLYRNVSRTLRPKDKDRGSGGGSFSSSSGTSFTGHSGKY
ncbi:MAG: TPM domain-containing protein [Eubacteriaceae bacterium]|nr:TPM domain-containing protein [Eubacteriaceae bacterium]